MDTNELSRLIPEAVVLIIVFGFLVKMAQLFKQIVDRIEESSKDRDDKLTKAILKNTTATVKNTQLVGETVKYLKHRNGTFEALIKDAPTLHELVKKANKE